MIDLQKYDAKVCMTAAALLIVEKKALFIKHKKLQIWFCPGGHIDENELPHRAAEREFWEETEVKVRAIDPFYEYDSALSEYLPSPIESNLHWVSEENYSKRLKSATPNKRNSSPLWKRGCEQHFGSLYLVEAVGNDGKTLSKIQDIHFKQNIEETDGIAWFSLDELDHIETNDDIRAEVKHGLQVLGAI